jgi:hypothetical protein
MKRYTGQQALYEAISRSRAKAKQGSILERLLPEHSKSENPAAKPVPPSGAQPESSVEPLPQAATVPEAVETPQPVMEPTQQVESQVQPSRSMAAESVPTPVESAQPVVKPRSIERIASPSPPSPVQTWLKPRPFQLNEGRIEISVPYYVGIIAGLAVLLALLGAFRLGQSSSGSQANEEAAKVQPAGDRSGGSTNPPISSAQGSAATDAARPQPNPTAPTGGRQEVAATGAQGDHWIVLAQYNSRRDLEKVQEYFAQQGIELGIMPLDSESRKAFAEAGFNANALPTGANFLLVTKNLYGNPKLAGSDGYAVKQKITEVGAKYRAPSGFERFAPNYFSDAYGMKIR